MVDSECRNIDICTSEQVELDKFLDKICPPDEFDLQSPPWPLLSSLSKRKVVISDQQWIIEP